MGTDAHPEYVNSHHHLNYQEILQRHRKTDFASPQLNPVLTAWQTPWNGSHPIAVHPIFHFHHASFHLYQHRHQATKYWDHIAFCSFKRAQRSWPTTAYHVMIDFIVLRRSGLFNVLLHYRLGITNVFFLPKSQHSSFSPVWINNNNMTHFRIRFLWISRVITGRIRFKSSALRDDSVIIVLIIFVIHHLQNTRSGLSPHAEPGEPVPRPTPARYSRGRRPPSGTRCTSLSRSCPSCRGAVHQYQSS